MASGSSNVVAPIDSPNFTGTPTAPTATAGDNSTNIATTGFVATSYAPLVSPAFTGTPTAPTPATGDNSTKIATTAFVNNLIDETINNLFSYPLFGGTQITSGAGSGLFKLNITTLNTPYTLFGQNVSGGIMTFIPSVSTTISVSLWSNAGVGGYLCPVPTWQNVTLTTPILVGFGTVGGISIITNQPITITYQYAITN